MCQVEKSFEIVGKAWGIYKSNWPFYETNVGSPKSMLCPKFLIRNLYGILIIDIHIGNR